MTGRPFTMSVCATSTLCAELAKSSITLKRSVKMVQCQMGKTCLSWQSVELIAAQMSTNLPGSKMQTCLCKPMCARQRARTTYFPCSAFTTDLNVCSSDKKREIHLNKCKHFVDVLAIGKQRETTSLPADWLWSLVHRKSVMRFGPSPGVSLYQKRPKEKNVFVHSIISAGIMGNLSSTYWPCYTMFECHNASASLPCTKILREWS